MSLYDLMNTIESIEFDATMSVFSGFRSFLSALKDNKTINSLSMLLRENSDLVQEIVERLLELINQNYKPQYAHPHDTAITSYLFVLNMVQQSQAGNIAERLRSVPNLFWTKELAERILAAEATTIQSNIVVTEKIAYPLFVSSALATVKLWSQPVTHQNEGIDVSNQAAGYTLTTIPSKQKSLYRAYA